MAMKETAFWRERKAELWAFGLKVEAGELTWAAVSRHFGKTVASCSQKYSQLKTDPAFHRPAEVISARAPRRAPSELWNEAKAATASDVERHRTERLATARIEDDRPIGIAAISDQHIRGSGPVDLERMEEDAKLVRTTPGLYALLGGDGVDNHIKHRSAMVGGGTKVADDWRRYDHYLRFFGADKILGMISGNHDDWTRDEAGVDMVAILAERNRVHYAPDELLLTLTLPGVEYRLKIRHQYRYNSSFNQVHVVKRLWEMGDDPFDVGIVCHHHEAAIEMFTKHGEPVWGARPGSYQVTSSHGRRYGFRLTRPTCPTFIFWPGQRRFIGLPDVRDAAEYLTWARKGKQRVA